MSAALGNVATRADGVAVQRIVQPAIAGIPIIHELHLPMELGPMSTVPWPGTRVTDSPITVRHVVADGDVSRFEQTLETPPWQTFYRDEAGETVIRFHEINQWVPATTMRTIREGELYELQYAEPPRDEVTNRGRDQIVMTLSLLERQRGLLVHSCGMRLPSGHFLLAPGVSGRGKSTLARLVQNSTSGISLLSDDRCVVTDDEGGFNLWGTPWPGDANAASVADGPLSAILLMGRSLKPSLRPATAEDVAHVLLETVVLPLWKPPLVDATLELADRLTRSTPAYFFDYPTVPGSADWLLEQFRDGVT